MLSSGVMASLSGSPPGRSKGALIRALRVKRGLTQEDLAEKAGISVWQLSRIECGKAEPTRETVESLAPVLGVTAAYLDVHALTEAVAEHATHPDTRSVLERVLSMNDSIAVMSKEDLERLFSFFDEFERGSED